jgi:hypothetical protein
MDGAGKSGNDVEGNGCRDAAAFERDEIGLN